MVFFLGVEVVVHEEVRMTSWSETMVERKRRELTAERSYLCFPKDPLFGSSMIYELALTVPYNELLIA